MIFLSLDRVTAWLTAELQQKVEQTAAANRALEREWSGNPGEAGTADLAVARLRLRPVRWPTADQLVEAAVRRRILLPDLIGPWRPLTVDEADRLRLPGRWLGSVSGTSEHRYSYDLDADLVLAVRTACFRRNEPFVAALIAERLHGPSQRRSASAQARKRQLQAEIFTPGRVVREAIGDCW